VIATFLVFVVSGLFASRNGPGVEPVASAALTSTPFGSTAPWNRPVAGIPIATNSATLVSHVWDSAPWPGQIKAFADAYTYPVYDIANATMNAPVHVINTAWGSNLLGKTVPWNPSWQPSAGPDGQVILTDPPSGREWDLWEVSFDGTTLTIGNGNLVPGSYWTNAAGYPPSRGAGIPYLAMLVRPSEVAAGVVQHALSMPLVKVASSYVAPATKSDGGGGTIPMGARFALNISDADINAWLSTLPLSATGKQSARVLAVALRDYGMFVTDNGGGPAVQFEDFQSGGTQWQALGLGSQTINGKTYPRDLFDGLITPSRLYALASSTKYPSLSAMTSEAPQSGSFSVGDASVVEGDTGTRTLTFPVTLSRAALAPVSVDYMVSGVTAKGGPTSGAGTDFKTAVGTLTFQPSASTGLTPTSRLVSITTYGDTTVEANETMAVTLFAPSGGFGLGRSVATGTILNDDTGSGVRVGVGDSSIVEGDSGSRNVVVRVTLSRAPGATVVTVPYTVHGVSATWGSSAANGADFGGATKGTLTFTGTAISKAVTIPVYGDLSPEPNETIQVTVGSVAGATVFRRTGTVTILNDD
jgi:hypothetical protein